MIYFDKSTRTWVGTGSTKQGSSNLSTFYITRTLNANAFKSYTGEGVIFFIMLQ